MASETKERTKTTKKKDINFKAGIRALIPQIYKDMSVRDEALAELDNIALYVGKCVVKSAVIIVDKETKTINGRAIVMAAVAVMPGELGAHARDQAMKAIKKSDSETSPEKRQPRAKKADLVISVSRAERLIREHGGCAYRVSASAGVALAAVIEYILAEVIEIAGKMTQQAKKVRISVKHVQEAVHQDAELFDVLGKGVFSGGGFRLVNERTKPRISGAAKETTKKKPSPAKETSKRKGPGRKSTGS